MKYSLLLAILALFVFACGEVGETSSPDDSPSSGSGPTSSQSGGSSSGGNSSSGGGNSSSSGGGNSSSGGEPVCEGVYCCNGASYNNEISFCYEEQLYPKCNSKDYNPYEKGCFGGELYDKCTNDKTRGTCVHESLLRCRQEGVGEDKIRDPLPRMECQENGAITGTIKDYRDSKIYKTVQIGNQVWMAENLNYDTKDETIEMNSQCYGKDPANCTKYGRLYDWAAAMSLPPACNLTSQNCPPSHEGLWGALCPNGFAIPRSQDWQALVDYAGGNVIAAGRLKSKTGWSGNGNGTDNYGFNALPGGGAFYWGDESYDEGNGSYWWVETQTGYEAYYWSIIASDTEARNHFWPKDMNMTYLRCMHY